MKFDKKNLISPEQDIKMSGVYVGYLILKMLKKEEKVSIFDLYSEIKKKNEIFNYGITIQALIFLYMNGLIDFSEPYIYRLK